MSDTLDFLREFEELCERYEVKKVSKAFDSPYFWVGGVSTVNNAGMTVYNAYPVKVYERFTWKDDDD